MTIGNSFGQSTTTQRHGLQILVVDDSTLMRVHLTGSLSALEGVAEIRQATDVPAGVRLLQERPVDVLILDIELPGQSGMELLKIVRKIDAKTVIIMISIHDHPSMRQKCADLGANYFFHKLTEFDRVAEVCRDLANRSERHRLEGALAAAEQRIAQLQSANDELLTFAYSVSHDLHAPLRQIQFFAGRLQQEAMPVLSEESHGHLTGILQVSKRMGTMIDALLVLARVGQSEMHKTAVDLSELVRDAIGDFEGETTARVIEWDIQSLPTVPADRALMRLVVMNLISNALKFTRQQARARITVGAIAERQGDVAIYVKDNGAGFDPRRSGKLFRVFERLHTQEQFSGTGVGLAIVRRIISRHGGQTWAEGAINAGATFYFSVPK